LDQPGTRFSYETRRITTKFVVRRREFRSDRNFSAGPVSFYRSATKYVIFQSTVNGTGQFAQLRCCIILATWVDVAMGHFDRTLAYISDLQQADTPGAVAEKLLDVTSAFGLTALMAGTVPPPGTPAGKQKDHILLCDYPAEWLERYVARNYVDHDPLVSRMRQSPEPIQWRDAAAEGIDADHDIETVMGEAAEFKLRDGLAFPLVTLDGQVVMVSLGGEQVEMSSVEFGMISLVATYAIGRAMQLHSNEQAIDHVELTPRESECLRWAAAGKSEWEISQILGISEHTSEKHLLNAKFKLGAVNRVQAVAEAIRRGYI